MVRTQVQITEAQAEGLRQLSAALGRSVSDLVREGVEKVLANRTMSPEVENRERARRICGAFASGEHDISEEHDRYLDEAYSQ
ncbi:MAG: ribbon-helix-helix domain-containing protein [Bryobacterales bacterium]|nr:ribbon-helix-helix domain-containing protein [Bryobacterales bacterium]